MIRVLFSLKLHSSGYNVSVSYCIFVCLIMYFIFFIVVYCNVCDVHTICMSLTYVICMLYDNVVIDFFYIRRLYRQVRISGAKK
jgi:hypothetical protein